MDDPDHNKQLSTEKSNRTWLHLGADVDGRKGMDRGWKEDNEPRKRVSPIRLGCIH